MTLYRAYRPQQFSDLLGQDAVARTLQRGLLLKRTAHAYLFSGPRGTGKTSTARLFARALVCTDPRADKAASLFEPCGICEACVSILQGSSTDLSEIDAASNRGIDDVRELRQSVTYPPVSLSHKIYIIDEVHMLTVEAFNALLKTLEEPPSQTVFILATTELHKVPFTVRSRCQTLLFSAAPSEVLVGKLQSICHAEGFEVEPEALQLIAQTANGGFRDAEGLLEKLTTEHQPLTADQVRQTVGIPNQTTVTSLLDAALQGRPDDLIEHFSNLSDQSPVDTVISHMITELRSRLASKAVDRHVGTLAYTELVEAYILAKSAPTPRTALEIALLSIADFGHQSEIQPVKQVAKPVQPPLEIITVKSKESAPELVKVMHRQSTEQAVPVIELQQDEPAPPSSDVRKAWKNVVEAICRENIVLGQTLKQTVLHTAENHTLTIHIRYAFHAAKLNEAKNVTRIKELLREHVGSDWKVEYSVVPNMPRQKPTRAIGSGVDDAVAVFGSSS